MLSDTQLAFDSVAADYDGPSGNNALIQRLRARTMAAVTKFAPPGSPIIDLGCGTGLDAVLLALQGYRVTAIDWSPEMVRRTQDRVSRAGLTERVTVQHLGIHQLDQLPASSFAAAYSDLGPLNCIPDLAAAAQLIANTLQPGGLLIASVIGKICPWELALFTVKRDWPRARLRFERELVPAPLNGLTIWTRYYTPREFQSLFATAGFKSIYLRALGVLVPSPYMLTFAERHPRLIDFLQGVEDYVAGWPVLREWGDHFLIVMEKAYNV